MDFTWSKSLALAGAVALAAVATGCGHDPIKQRLDRPGYYADNALPFQPDRIWRLKVRWEPYLLDRTKAMIIKQFQLITHSDLERRRLETEIAAHGGDSRYLRWLEAEVFPLGNWETREEALITRLSDSIVVSLRTRASKEVKMAGQLSVSPIWFPDPLMRAVTDGCHALDWDVIPGGESIGFEVVLESRKPVPGAKKWLTREYNSKRLWWRQWSVGQEHSIAYRTLVEVKSNIARCPLPPAVFEQVRRLRAGQPMGVDW